MESARIQMLQQSWRRSRQDFRAAAVIAARCAASGNHGAIRSGIGTSAHPPCFTRTR
jgi:hypothetical protein